MFATDKPVPALSPVKVKGKAQLFTVLEDGFIPFGEKSMQKVLERFLFHRFVSPHPVYFKACLPTTAPWYRASGMDNPITRWMVSIAFFSILRVKILDIILEID
jgi:hypothetical protein